MNFKVVLNSELSFLTGGFTNTKDPIISQIAGGCGEEHGFMPFSVALAWKETQSIVTPRPLI